MSKNTKPMMLVSLAYADYVLPVEDAVAVMQLLAAAEKYEKRYVNATGEYAHFVYPSDLEVTCKLISADLYQMAKLAGKPDKN